MKRRRLEGTLARVLKDLRSLEARCAVLGGLAVSARREPRFTRDIDLAVSVAHDGEAETLIRSLRLRGYEVLALVEQKARGRLATARLVPPGEDLGGVVVDLLFASSGVEPEIVEEAEPIEFPGGIRAPVATAAHLIATKVLARDDDHRPQDSLDLRVLLKTATALDIRAARALLRKIAARGFHRGRDLEAGLDRAIREARQRRQGGSRKAGDAGGGAPMTRRR